MSREEQIGFRMDCNKQLERFLVYLFFADQILNFEAYRIYVLQIEIAFNNINPYAVQNAGCFQISENQGIREEKRGNKKKWIEGGG